MTPPAKPPSAYRTPLASGGRSASIVTVLFLLPSAGAQNSGMRVMFAGKLPLAIWRRDAQFGMEDGHPQTAADREHRVSGGLDGEQFAHLGQLFGHLGGQVVGLGPVLVEVIQLPAVVVGCPVADSWRRSRQPGHPRTERRGHPAVVIDSPTAHHLEVLRLLAPRRGAVGESAGETCSGDGDLGHTVDGERRLDTHDVVDGRHDVVDMQEVIPRQRVRPRPSSASGSPAGCGCRPDARRAVSRPCTACCPPSPSRSGTGCRSSVSPGRRGRRVAPARRCASEGWSECRSAQAVRRWCRPGPRPRIRCRPRCRETACCPRSPADPAHRRSGRPGRHSVRRTRPPPPSAGAETASRPRGCRPTPSSARHAR